MCSRTKSGKKAQDPVYFLGLFCIVLSPIFLFLANHSRFLRTRRVSILVSILLFSLSPLLSHRNK